MRERWREIEGQFTSQLVLHARSRRESSGRPSFSAQAAASLPWQLAEVAVVLQQYMVFMGWDDLNWLEDVHMGYEEGEPRFSTGTSTAGSASPRA